MSEIPGEKARILFVDDDQRVLDGLAASLRRQRSKWSMEFVCGGSAALARLEASPFDAVVTDMRMPGIDGEAVLIAARARRPSALRFILSGQTERAVVRRTVGIAHQFLSKPCSVEELRDCLQRTLDLRATLNEPTREVVCGMGNLAASPHALAELQLLAKRPALKVSEIAACVEQDAALAAKLLHVASGGFYAARQPVASIEAAVVVLGVETTLAVLSSVEPSPLRPNLTRLSSRANATRQLLARMLDSADARLCGALHDIGKLGLLSHFGEDYAVLLTQSDADPSVPLEQLELERFGMSCQVVGASLLGLWGVAAAPAEAIRSHGDPDRVADGNELALALHVACALTHGAAIDKRSLSEPWVAERLPLFQGWAREIDAEEGPLP